MKENELHQQLNRFKVEELEPRLEMAKWTAKVSSTQNFKTGDVTMSEEITYTTTTD
jgi:hypothetical protein